MANNAKGALFKNDRKQGNNHPDYKGNFTLTRELLSDWAAALGSSNELKVYMSAWIKKGQTGNYLSLSVEAPWKKDGGSTRPAPKPQSRDDEEEAPF